MSDRPRRVCKRKTDPNFYTDEDFDNAIDTVAPDIHKKSKLTSTSSSSTSSSTTTTTTLPPPKPPPPPILPPPIYRKYKPPELLSEPPPGMKFIKTYIARKTSLESVLLPNRGHEQIIDDCVEKINPVVRDLMNLINLHALVCFRDNLPLPDSYDKYLLRDFLKVITTTNAKEKLKKKMEEDQLNATTTSTTTTTSTNTTSTAAGDSTLPPPQQNKRNPLNPSIEQIQHIYDNDFQTIYNHQPINITGDYQVLGYEEDKIVIGISNHIKQNFVKHLHHFINCTLDHMKIKLEDNEIQIMKRHLLKLTVKDMDVNLKTKINDWLTLYQHQILPMNNIRNCHYYNVKANPYVYLKHMMIMNHLLDEINQQIRATNNNLSNDQSNINNINKRRCPLSTSRKLSRRIKIKQRNIIAKNKREADAKKYQDKHPEKILNKKRRQRGRNKNNNSNEIKKNEKKKHPSIKQYQLHQVLPLRHSSIPKSITIDTSTIKSKFRWIIYEEKVIDGIKKTVKLKTKEVGITTHKHQLWGNILNLDHQIFKPKQGYHFNGLIHTNGVSLSLIFMKCEIKNMNYQSPKHINLKRSPFNPHVEVENNIKYIDTLTQEELNALRGRPIVGVDPGKINIACVSNVNGNSIQYSSKQRHKESKYFRNQQILIKEKNKRKINNKSIVQIESKLTLHNSKSVNVQIFKLYLRCQDECHQLTKDFYSRKIWRNINHRAYVYSKKSLERFMNLIQKIYGKHVIIILGNWNQKQQMKFHLPSIGKAFRKRLSERFTVLLIDEFNTSKNCHRCSQQLSDKDPKDNKLYRICYCNCCNKYWRRDHNAARNMAKLAEHQIYIKNERMDKYQRNVVGATVVPDDDDMIEEIVVNDTEMEIEFEYNDNDNEEEHEY